MTRWIVRLTLGFILGLVGLYFQYQAMQGGDGDVEGGGEAGVVEGEGGAGAKAKEKPRVKGVPNDLMDQIEKGQQSGGRSRKGRRRD